jgi:hypothetical protein
MYSALGHTGYPHANNRFLKETIRHEELAQDKWAATHGKALLRYNKEKLKLNLNSLPQQQQPSSTSTTTNSGRIFKTNDSYPETTYIGWGIGEPVQSRKELYSNAAPTNLSGSYTERTDYGRKKTVQMTFYDTAGVTCLSSRYPTTTTTSTATTTATTNRKTPHDGQHRKKGKASTLVFQ